MTEESMEGYSELAEESMEGYSKLAEESMEDHSELTEGSTEEVYDHLNTSRLTEGSMEEGYSKLTEMENFEDDKLAHMHAHIIHLHNECYMYYIGMMIMVLL